METLSYTVVTARLGEALEALTKLARKAERLGSPKILWTVGQPYELKLWNSFHRPIIVSHTDIELAHTIAPTVGNFKFVAKIEVTAAGAIIDTVPGAALPERFRNAQPTCDHCKADRYRKEVFVCENVDNGEFVQVGRTCLREFLGTDTPATVISAFRFLHDIREESESWGGSVAACADSADELLAVTACAIRLWGWVPKSAPESAGTPTAYKVAHWYYVSPEDKAGQADRAELRANICDADWELATTVREWVAASDDNSDYMHNLRVILVSNYVEQKRRGYACSAVAAYQRAMGKLEMKRIEKESKAGSVHVGEVGARFKDIKMVLESSRGFDSHYGVTVLYKFRDEAGNCFSWFSSGGADLTVGKWYTVTATVKEHAEYQGIKETRLTRAKAVQA